MLPSTLTKLLFYNPDTGNLTWQSRPESMFKTNRAWKSWNTRYAGNAALSTLGASGYLHGTIFGKSYSAHRVAWTIFYGRWPECELDHINRDKLDNRIDNLRDVSKSQNMENVGISSRNKSGVVGVHFYEQTKRWRATYKTEHLGYFLTKDEAVKARYEAELR